MSQHFVGTIVIKLSEKKKKMLHLTINHTIFTGVDKYITSLMLKSNLWPQTHTNVFLSSIKLHSNLVSLGSEYIYFLHTVWGELFNIIELLVIQYLFISFTHWEASILVIGLAWNLSAVLVNTISTIDNM